MRTGRFDECCPHCEKEIAHMATIFCDRDYQSDFTFECPHCEKEIQCNVHSVPEFELSKAETPEEYAAKVKRLKEAIGATNP